MKKKLTGHVVPHTADSGQGVRRADSQGTALRSRCMRTPGSALGTEGAMLTFYENRADNDSTVFKLVISAH